MERQRAKEAREQACVLPARNTWQQDSLHDRDPKNIARAKQAALKENTVRLFVEKGALSELMAILRKSRLAPDRLTKRSWLLDHESQL